jgi:hypothetical protein
MSYPPVYESTCFIDQNRDIYDSSKSCGSCRFLCCSSSLSKTMDVFSMIKHSIISDEVNPITRYFDIRQHVSSCGPEMVWKIFDAVRLEDNKVSNNCQLNINLHQGRHKMWVIGDSINYRISIGAVKCLPLNQLTVSPNHSMITIICFLI